MIAIHYQKTMIFTSAHFLKRMYVRVCAMTLADFFMEFEVRFYRASLEFEVKPSSST